MLAWRQTQVTPKNSMMLLRTLTLPHLQKCKETHFVNITINITNAHVFMLVLSRAIPHKYVANLATTANYR